MFDHFVRIALLHDVASVHKDDPIRYIPCEFHLMGDDHHRHLFLCQLTDDLQNLSGQFRVQS